MEHKAEMERYIDQVHKESWHLLRNNCFHKSIRIVRKAKSLGILADLVVSIGRPPKKLWGVIPLIFPTGYALVNGIKVSVALSPEQEETHWKNGEMRSYLPLKIRC